MQISFSQGNIKIVDHPQLSIEVKINGINDITEKDVVLHCAVAKEDTILDIQVVSDILPLKFIESYTYQLIYLIVLSIIYVYVYVYVYVYIELFQSRICVVYKKFRLHKNILFI